MRTQAAGIPGGPGEKGAEKRREQTTSTHSPGPPDPRAPASPLRDRAEQRHRQGHETAADPVSPREPGSTRRALCVRRKTTREEKVRRRGQRRQTDAQGHCAEREELRAETTLFTHAESVHVLRAARTRLCNRVLTSHTHARTHAHAHTCTHMHTCTHTHARARAHAHAHLVLDHFYSFSLLSLSSPKKLTVPWGPLTNAWSTRGWA